MKKLPMTLFLLSVGLRSLHADPLPAGPAGDFYVNPGIAIMNAKDFGNSFSLDAGYLKQFHPIAAFGYEAGYLFGADFKGTDGEPFAAGLAGQSFTSDTHAKILHLSPEIKLGPTLNVGGFQVSPFIIGGGGFYWTHLNSGTATLSDGSTLPISSTDHYNGGWNLGIGTSLVLPGNWSVGFDIRRQDIVNKHYADTVWVTPALRLALQF